MTLSLGSSARAYMSACGSSSSNGRSSGNGRPQVVLREALELVQHLLVQEAEAVDQRGRGVRDRHAGIVGGPHDGGTADRGTSSNSSASARSGACPPRWAGYHGACSPGGGTWSGWRWSPSTRPVSEWPSRVVAATRSSSGGTVNGSPNVTSTGRCR